MDKQEYKVKLDQINKLAEEGDFKGAADIVDTIDWRHVKSVRTLCMVAEIYEANKRYDDSVRILKYAYRRSSSSKTVLYRLTELSVRQGDLESARAYSREFEELSPNDSSKYILRYKVARAEGRPIGEQIRVLEELKEREYTERWAYELARLYYRSGQENKCVDECDDMILWFSEGRYVTKAMELKMQIRPLTPAQRKKYENRYQKPADSAGMSRPTEFKSAATAGYDTVDQVIRQNDEEDTDKESFKAASVIDRMDQAAAAAIPEERAAGSSLAASKSVSFGTDTAANRAVSQARLADSIRAVFSGMQDPETVRLDENIDAAVEVFTDDDVEEYARTQAGDVPVYNVPSLEPESIRHGEVVITPESAGTDDGERQMTLDDFSGGTTGTIDLKKLFAETSGHLASEIATGDYAKTDALLDENGVAQTAAPAAAAGTAAEEVSAAEETVAAAEAVVEEAAAAAPEPVENVISEDAAELAAEAESAGEETVEAAAEEAAETVEEAAPAEEIGEEAIEAVEEVVEEPAVTIIEEPSFTLPTEDEINEMIESAAQEPADAVVELKAAAAAERETEVEAEPAEIPEEETAELTEEEAAELTEDEAPIAEEAVEAAMPAAEEAVEPEVPAEETEAAEPAPAPTDLIDQDVTKELPTVDEEGNVTDAPLTLEVDREAVRAHDESLGLTREYNFMEELQKAMEGGASISDAAEAVRARASEEAAGAVESTEATLSDTQDMPFEIVTNRKSLNETAAEMSDLTSVDEMYGDEEGSKSIIENIMEEPERLEIVDVEPRKLDETEVKVFTYFSKVPGIAEQVTEAIADVHNNAGDKTSRSGNIVMIGRQGSGKTRLADALVLAICRDLGIEGAKLAHIIGEDLNKKDPAKVVAKMSGGFLVIEGAGSMDENTVNQLNAAMEFRTDDLVVILEDEKKDVLDLLKKYPAFAEKFSSYITIPVFTNDELVTFGRTYCKELGYKMDEMCVLALYTMIGDNQKDREPVTVGKVRDMIDAAIAHAEKGSRRFGRRLSRKETDPSGRIILHEKDFNF